MQTTPNGEIWLSSKDIQRILSVSKTKAYQIIGQIRDEDPNDVLEFDRCVRVSDVALMRFIERHRYQKD